MTAANSHGFLLIMSSSHLVGAAARRCSVGGDPNGAPRIPPGSHEATFDGGDGPLEPFGGDQVAATPSERSRATSSAGNACARLRSSVSVSL